jgi:SAM-dependent methyltransferase
MVNLDYLNIYQKFIRRLLHRHPIVKAMELAPGGAFEKIGILERELLIQLGLRSDGYVIDVGCGSGRLAKPLSEYLSGKYLGIDIVPELVEYARNLVRRPGWRFEVAKGLRIPEKAKRADMVCFFSVFTHLYHEHSYVYLKEAARVLRPDGKIIFSFLEFSIPEHWTVFEATLKNMNAEIPPNVFLSRDAIHAWATHLNLKVQIIEDGNRPNIHLRQPFVLADGTVMEGNAKLGQSICVLCHK